MLLSVNFDFFEHLQQCYTVPRRTHPLNIGYIYPFFFPSYVFSIIRSLRKLALGNAENKQKTPFYITNILLRGTYIS